MVLRAVEQAGPLQLILAHMGGWRNWDQVEELLPHTHVYLDTAYALGRIAHRGDGHFAPEELDLMSKAQFLRMVDTFGAHRILFGTDSPWRGQEEGIAQLRALPLSQPDLEAILGGNAQRLLGLS